MVLPPPSSRHVPALMDELLEEIFIRLLLDDPAILFRAALVCKSWCLLISGHSLRHRLLEFHGSPPLRGFFCRIGGEPASRFDEDLPELCGKHINLVLWNPGGGKVLRLPRPPMFTYQWNTALLCTAPGCGHLDCGYGSGQFQVVLAGIRPSNGLTFACVCSSEQRTWSKPVSAWLNGVQVKVGSNARAIAGNILCLLCDMAKKVLKYDMGKQELSLIRPPIPDDTVSDDWRRVALMRAEGGGLGFAMTQKFKLFMWSKEAAGLDNEDAGWVQRRVIDLYEMIPDAWFHWVPFSAPKVSAVAEHVGIIFVDMCAGLFSIDLKSGLVRKLLVSNYIIRDVVPYMSFCTPGISLVSCSLAPIF
ncbi:unnamed protein product [Urochloa decumbens]|uniref:F-box domain-containing protein n=1 Tax=Urochloa decumbens TaxID=240449 RepID=A0ABC9FMV0_9POAL